MVLCHSGKQLIHCNYSRYFIPCFPENMKRIKGNENISENPAEKVVSTEDLLIQILLRLPVRSLLRFMSVSKHWYSVISTPSFKLLHITTRNPNPPLGLFVPVKTNVSRLEFEFVSFDIENPVKAPFRTLNFDPNVERIDIEHSCNGLMLCSSRNVNPTKNCKYYIYNPSVNRFTVLPKFTKYDKFERLGMTVAFNPLKSLHYKVVYVSGYGPSNYADEGYQIGIYSSETRTCKPSLKFVLGEEFDLDYGSGVYWNNEVHWLHHTGFVLHFSMERETLRHIYTPFTLFGLDHEIYSSYIFESRDHLLVVEIPTPYNTEFDIYELKKDYSGWFIKFQVDLEEVAESFPEITDGGSYMFKFDILSIVLGENEDDSFMVLQIPGKVLRYNLVSNALHKLHDFAAAPVSDLSINFGLELIHSSNVFQFKESLYSV